MTYDNDAWTVVGEFWAGFLRDSAGYLYRINDKYSPYTVTRYNQCGKPVAELILPEADYTIIPSGNPGIEDRWIVNSEYMNPKIDSHGNVYATRRTPDNYSLVKWTWQDTANDRNDGPDAPINLTAAIHNGNSVELKWEGSLQDPGCVTGYRVLRSETEGDDGVEVFKLEKGTHKGYDVNIEADKTYYYRIQALSDVEDSDLSNEANVVIPAE